MPWWTSHQFQLQLELAAAQARQVEQVIDQAGFEFNVSLGGAEDGADFVGDAGFVGQGGDGGEHGRQGRAQLVGEHGQEMVLGLAGGLGLGAERGFLGQQRILGTVDGLKFAGALRDALLPRWR